MGDVKEDLSDTTPQGIPFVMPTLIEPFGSSLLKAMLMEYIATCLFLYTLTGAVTFGCPANAVHGACPMDFPRMLVIAFTAGFCIFVFVYFSASFSGGHLNPAVSLGLLLSNKISVMRFLAYVPMQMLGAMTGAAIASLGDNGAFRAFGGAANGVSSGILPERAFGLETMSTFILMFTILAATDTKRYPNLNHLPALAPFAIGIAVFVGHLVLLPIDGCSLNPARSFGSAVVAGKWQNHWVFWAGPLLGGTLASLVYEIIFRPDYEKLATGRDEVIQNLANSPEMPPPRTWRTTVANFIPKMSVHRAKSGQTAGPKQAQSSCASTRSEGGSMAEP